MRRNKKRTEREFSLYINNLFGPIRQTIDIEEK